MGARRKPGCGEAPAFLVIVSLLLPGCTAPAVDSAPAASLAGLHSSSSGLSATAAPARFKGLDVAELLALLGNPDFRRIEPPAELWQYRASDCVLDLYLYPTADGYRVADAERRGRDPATIRAGRCGDGVSPARAALP